MAIRVFSTEVQSQVHTRYRSDINFLMGATRVLYPGIKELAHANLPISDYNYHRVWGS